mgnify:CR=1 FL=1
MGSLQGLLGGGDDILCHGHSRLFVVFANVALAQGHATILDDEKIVGDFAVQGRQQFLATLFRKAGRVNGDLHLLDLGTMFLERCDRLGHGLDVFVDGVDGVLVVDGFDNHCGDVVGGVLWWEQIRLCESPRQAQEQSVTIFRGASIGCDTSTR